MHILVMILGALGGAGFWFYRMRDAGRAAGQVIDTAQRVKGSIKRKRFRDKAEQSPFLAIDDPVLAAVTSVIAIAAECGTWNEPTKSKLNKVFLSVSDEAALEEAIIYGEWAVKQVTEMSGALRHLGPLLASMLTLDQRQELLEMAEQVLPSNGQSERYREKGLNMLRQKMGLQLNG